jgi:hypothetical protein
LISAKQITTHHPPLPNKKMQRRTHKQNLQHNKLGLFLSKNSPLTQESERTRQAARSPAKRKIAWWSRREYFSTRHRSIFNTKCTKVKGFQTLISRYKMLFTVERAHKRSECGLRLCARIVQWVVGPRGRERRRMWRREEEREVSETWKAEWQCELGACAKAYMQTQCAKQQQEQVWITDVPTHPNPAEIFCPKLFPSFARGWGLPVRLSRSFGIPPPAATVTSFVGSNGSFSSRAASKRLAVCCLSGTLNSHAASVFSSSENSEFALLANGMGLIVCHFVVCMARHGEARRRRS